MCKLNEFKPDWELSETDQLSVLLSVLRWLDATDEQLEVIAADVLAWQKQKSLQNDLQAGS